MHIEMLRFIKVYCLLGSFWLFSDQAIEDSVIIVLTICHASFIMYTYKGFVSIFSKCSLVVIISFWQRTMLTILNFRVISSTHWVGDNNIIALSRIYLESIFKYIKHKNVKACLAANWFYHREVIITRQQQSALFNCRSFRTSELRVVAEYLEIDGHHHYELSNNKRNCVAQKSFKFRYLVLLNKVAHKHLLIFYILNTSIKANLSSLLNKIYSLSFR